MPLYRNDLSIKALGQLGEKIAVLHVQRLGWKVLQTNWRCKYGEIDLVAQDGLSLVVIEVRTRRGKNALDLALQSITPKKQKRLAILTEIYRDLNPSYSDMPIRIDAIGVAVRSDGWIDVEVVSDVLGW